MLAVLNMRCAVGRCTAHLRTDVRCNADIDLGLRKRRFHNPGRVDPDYCRQWRRVHFCCCGVDPRGRVVPDAARSKNQGGNRYVGVRGVGEPGDGGNLGLYRCGSTDIQFDPVFLWARRCYAGARARDMASLP